MMKQEMKSECETACWVSATHLGGRLPRTSTGTELRNVLLGPRHRRRVRRIGSVLQTSVCRLEYRPCCIRISRSLAAIPNEQSRMMGILVSFRFSHGQRPWSEANRAMSSTPSGSRSCRHSAGRPLLIPVAVPTSLSFQDVKLDDRHQEGPHRIELAINMAQLAGKATCQSRTILPNFRYISHFAQDCPAELEAQRPMTPLRSRSAAHRVLHTLMASPGRPLDVATAFVSRFQLAPQCWFWAESRRAQRFL